MIEQSFSWSLSDNDLVSLLCHQQIQVVNTSKFVDVLRALAGRKPSSHWEADNKLIAAVAAVAQPAVEWGLLLTSPYQPRVQWYYRGQNGNPILVGYDRPASGQHLLAIASEEELFDRLCNCLQLQIPGGGSAFEVRLSKIGFQTLLGLFDCHRERTLVSLIQRLVPDYDVYNTAPICAAFNQSLGSSDLRWLTEIARVVSPFGFGLSRSQAAEGLQELTDLGLMTPNGNGWKMAAALQSACLTIEAPVAFGAIHARRFSTASPTQECLWAFRALGNLWLVQFSESALADYSVLLRSITAPELELLLAEEFSLLERQST